MGAILHSQSSILPHSPRRWSAALLLISAALLGYELLLMRLLTLAYWGHFASLVISIAMLGIAGSGLFLFFCRTRVRTAPEKYFSVSAGLFGLTAPAAFLLSQRLPFTPFLLSWSPHEYVLLGARAFFFTLPFLAGGIAIGVPFVARVRPPGRLYFWNMLGSAVPALPLLFAMNFFHPMRLLSAIAAIALGAALLGERRWIMRIALLVAGGLVLFVTSVTSFRYSEYKELPKTLLLPESRVVEERYGWDGLVHVVESPHTRYLPGLSLNFTGSLPRSRLVFTDAAAMTLVFAANDALAAPEFLRMTPEAFSFELKATPSLLQFYGGAADLLRAHAFQARTVRLVDDSDARVTAERDLFAVLPGSDGTAHGRHLFLSGDARQTLEQEHEPTDIIATSLLGSHGTSTAGAASLDPSFLLTVEGISRLFDRLTPQGHAVFTVWVENPARSGPRLAALCIETLRRRGIANPSRHLIAFRSWSTLAIFMSREPFPPAATRALKKFCEENSFDLVWFDGIDRAETNQINVIPEDPYHGAFAALLGTEASQFKRHSPFDLTPPADDRPFFNQYFRWAALSQWMTTMGMAWLPFVEWGYIMHVAAFAVVTLLGLVLLLGPCLLTRARPGLRTALLFFALGVAYMFVEIWAIYKVTQLVAHPLLASALVLSAMFAASGAGAALLTDAGRLRPTRSLVFLCGAVGISILLLPSIVQLFFAQAIGTRAFLAVAWVAAPAFFMGFPFPYALSRLAEETDVPWALALNGFGSVVGSLLAILIAAHFGFLVLGVAAIAFYLLVALLCRGHGAEISG